MCSSLVIPPVFSCSLAHLRSLSYRSFIEDNLRCSSFRKTSVKVFTRCLYSSAYSFSIRAISALSFSLAANSRLSKVARTAGDSLPFISFTFFWYSSFSFWIAAIVSLVSCSAKAIRLALPSSIAATRADWSLSSLSRMNRDSSCWSFRRFAASLSALPVVSYFAISFCAC